MKNLTDCHSCNYTVLLSENEKLNQENEILKKALYLMANTLSYAHQKENLSAVVDAYIRQAQDYIKQGF